MTVDSMIERRDVCGNIVTRMDIEKTRLHYIIVICVNVL